ncbi:MAG: MFS transporter, partial [Clostridiales bacterium]|nr:MFS transporter [Clostridiales bacterium]
PKILKEDKKFKKFIIIGNLASFSIMLLPFYMIYAKDVFNVDTSYIGKYLIFQITGTIFSNFIWVFIAKKYNSKTIIKICIVLGGLIPIVAIMLSKLGPDYFMLLFVLIGFVISGRRVGFEPYLLDIAPSDKRTEYLGINGTLNIFIVILPILGGTFIDLIGYHFTFIMVTIAMIIAFILLNSND